MRQKDVCWGQSSHGRDQPMLESSQLCLALHQGIRAYWAEWDDGCDDTVTRLGINTKPKGHPGME